jgi:putative SOS response-associated peptidase YedK
MCGRFTVKSPADILIEEFGLTRVSAEFAHSYNIAPTQMAPVVAHFRTRELELFQWGLVPSWAKDRRVGARLINARAETVRTQPAFRDAFEKRRCLVLADGFYEWKREVGRKIPMYVRRACGRPMAFAGLWEAWLAPDGEMLRTCTVITTEPNATMAPIHDRMPVILPADAREVWLDPDIQDAAALSALLRPYAVDDLEAFSVSPRVNSVANNDPECIEPEDPKGTLPMFPNWTP